MPLNSSVPPCCTKRFGSGGLSSLPAHTAKTRSKKKTGCSSQRTHDQPFAGHSSYMLLCQPLACKNQTHSSIRNVSSRWAAAASNNTVASQHSPLQSKLDRLTFREDANHVEQAQRCKLKRSLIAFSKNVKQRGARKHRLRFSISHIATQHLWQRWQPAATT